MKRQIIDLTQTSSDDDELQQNHKIPKSDFQFCLTAIQGIPERGTVTLKDLLSQKPLVEMFQFNYLVDLEWLMSQTRRDLKTTVYHGLRHGGESLAAYNQMLKQFPNVASHQPPLPISYGTHHTKMMVLFYEDQTAQIIIHTANLRRSDWALKTQGVWRGPIMSKGEATNDFKRDFLQYLRAYGSMTFDLMKLLNEYDFTGYTVKLIASVPGRHTELSKWGHMKMRSCLKACDAGPGVDDIVCQISSIGSLGTSAEAWLTKEFQESLGTSSGTRPLQQRDTRLKIVFPTVENVRNSLEGYAAGDAIPFDNKNWIKQKSFMMPILHEWSAVNRNRNLAMPHIKTFTRFGNDGNCRWFLLTSSNLSKAAWGTLEKNRSQLMIRSYELGVLSFGESLVPYDWPLKKYHSNQEAWTWNISHSQPDSQGNPRLV